MDPNPAPAGALFDWDGVLIDSSAQHEKSWELLAREVGKPLPSDHFKRGFGKKNAVIIPEFGWSEDPAEIARLGRRKEELYRELVHSEGVTALPGGFELVGALREAGIPCSIGSSTERLNIDVILEVLGRSGSFDAIVTAEDVVHGKPEPDVFLTGARRIGVPARRCVVFEDAFVGIEAARRGGMKVIAVATTNPIATLSHADLAVHSLEEVRPGDVLRILGPEIPDASPPQIPHGV